MSADPGRALRPTEAPAQRGARGGSGVGLSEAIAAGERRRADMSARRSGDRPSLPLRWWRQQAHLTVPGSDAAMVRKALERGTGPMARLMAAVGVDARDVAERLGAEIQVVEQLLERPRSASVVVVDLEDAQADRMDVRATGVANAAQAFSSDVAPRAAGRPLRFLRPPGLGARHGVTELLAVLWAAQHPPDAVVLPKVRDADEVGLLLELLDTAERARAFEPGSIRVSLLVESAPAVLRLADIAERAGSRLCGLIFGPADFASDIGLPEVGAEHPVAVWARTQVIAVAASRAVPAIDGMTFAYPVPDPTVGAAASRETFLDRLGAVYADARAAHAMGMHGKWVGHPAQLFATLLAFETAVSAAALETAASSVERYRAARDDGLGATMIDGRMADVATDRHARMLLRDATANGRFDPQRALSLGIVDATERDQVIADMGDERR